MVTESRRISAQSPSSRDGQGVGPHQPGDRLAEGTLQVAFGLELGGEQMGDHLGIGLGHETVTLLLQLGAQFGVVLDDAVVHHRHPLAAHVRMGIALGGDAVGGPAGVGDAQLAMDGIGIEALLQRGHLAHGTDALQPSRFVADGDACRVVAAVFQAAQPFHQYRGDVPAANGANDSTHLQDSFLGLCQPSTVTCRGRVRVSFCSGASRVMTEPAPMVAPSPMLTGATSALLEPMKASSPMSV